MSRASTPTKPAMPMPPGNMMSVPQDKIAMLAYEKWCKRGRPHGTNMQDWLEAEKELMNSMKGKK